MSKPLWWKNSVKIIKSLTSDESFATFEREDGNWITFFYHLQLEGRKVTFEESASVDILNKTELVDQIFDALVEGYRLQIENFIAQSDIDHIVGL
jgi:hypothetical protein